MNEELKPCPCREILFRGKSKRRDCWIIGNYIKQYNRLTEEYKDYIINESADVNDTEYGMWYEVIPETVGEYTGLCDKNGKRIFEGDIVEVEDEIVEESNTEAGFDCNSWKATAHFLIGWDEKEAAYRIVGSNYGNDLCNSQFCYDVSPDGNGDNFVEAIRERAKVVGNIHDNPELLEAGNG